MGIQTNNLNLTTSVWKTKEVWFFQQTATGITLPTLTEYTDGSGYPGVGSGNAGNYGHAMTHSGEVELTFNCSLPPDWKLGTSIYPYFQHGCKTNNSGNVRFGLEYSVAKSGQSFHVTAPATTHRESADTVKKVWFGSTHGFRLGRSLVVSGLGGTGYSGNSQTDYETFVVTDFSDIAPDYWIQYTGASASIEEKTEDTGGTIIGYTHRATEITIAVPSNDQGVVHLQEMSEIKMDLHNTMMPVILGRFYRVTGTSVSGSLNEAYYIFCVGFFYESQVIGSSARS